MTDISFYNCNLNNHNFKLEDVQMIKEELNFTNHL